MNGGTRDTLIRNTFWYAVITVTGLLSGLVMSVILARGLGPRLMGEYSYLLWAMRTITAFATLGFHIATVRYSANALAKQDSPLAWGYVQLLLRWQLIASCAALLVVIPVAIAEASSGLRWPFVAAAIALFPSTVEVIYTHALQGAQRYDLTALVSALKMTLQLTAAAAALWLGGGILGLVIGVSIATVICAEVKRRQARSVYDVRPAEVPAEARLELRSFLIPLSMVAVLESLVWDRSEVFFLRLYASPQDIAFYSLAFGLATKAMVLPEVAGGVLLPAFSALHGSGTAEEFSRVYRTALRYVALAGAPIVVIGVALAHRVVTLLYGEEYLPVAWIFQVLIVVAALGALRQVAWAALRAVGDRRAALAATWVSAVGNVTLAAVLIPHLGTTGAVIANTAAQVVATVWAFVAMARLHHCRFPLGQILRIGAVAAIALAVSSGLLTWNPSASGLAAAGLAGLGAFFVGCLLVRVVKTNELVALAASTLRVVAPRESGA